MRAKKRAKRFLVLMMVLTALLTFGMSGNAMAANKKVGSTKITSVKRSFYKIVYDFRGAKYKIRWKKVKGASGYEVESAEKVMYGEPFQEPSIDTVKKTGITIKTSNVSAFRVRVRAFRIVNGVKVYGRWTKYYRDTPGL